MATNILSPAQAESLRIQASVICAGLSLQPQYKNAPHDVLLAVAFQRLVKCAELGLHPNLAADAMYEVNGRPCMPTQMIQSVAEASGVVDWTDEEGVDGTVEFQGQTRTNYYAEVTMWLVDKPQRKHTERWDIRRGIESGYALDRNGIKATWLANGSLMPYNRAFCHALRRVAPGVTLGVYSLEEMGYTQDEMQGRNWDDPEAPIGEEQAAAILNKLRPLPDAAGALEALKAYKAAHWGSPDYKLEAVPQKDFKALSDWADAQTERFGKRIGVKRADRARKYTMDALRGSGMTDTEASQFVSDYEAEIGVDRLADMTPAQEAELAARVKAETSEPRDALEGEFEPDPAPTPPRPLERAPEPAQAQEQAIDAKAWFPAGDLTPITEWRAKCAEHGLQLTDQQALQEAALGSVRPPDSPDEMLALLNETCKRFAAQGQPDTGLFEDGE